MVSAAEKAYREVGEHARRLSGTRVSPISAALNPTNPPPGADNRTRPDHHLTTPYTDTVTPSTGKPSGS